MQEKKQPLSSAEYIKRKIFSARCVPLSGDDEVFILSGTAEQVIDRARCLCSWGSAGLGAKYEIVLQEVKSDVV